MEEAALEVAVATEAGEAKEDHQVVVVDIVKADMAVAATVVVAVAMKVVDMVVAEAATTREATEVVAAEEATEAVALIRRESSRSRGEETAVVVEATVEEVAMEVTMAVAVMVVEETRATVVEATLIHKVQGTHVEASIHRITMTISLIMAMEEGIRTGSNLTVVMNVVGMPKQEPYNLRLSPRKRLRLRISKDRYSLTLGNISRKMIN